MVMIPLVVGAVWNSLSRLAAAEDAPVLEEEGACGVTILGLKLLLRRGTEGRASRDVLLS